MVKEGADERLSGKGIVDRGRGGDDGSGRLKRQMFQQQSGAVNLRPPAPVSESRTSCSSRAKLKADVQSRPKVIVPRNPCMFRMLQLKPTSSSLSPTGILLVTCATPLAD